MTIAAALEYFIVNSKDIGYTVKRVNEIFLKFIQFSHNCIGMSMNVLTIHSLEFICISSIFHLAIQAFWVSFAFDGFLVHVYYHRLFTYFGQVTFPCYLSPAKCK